MVIWQKCCFGQFYHSRIEVLQIAQLLALVIFELVSLMRENLRELRENFKHKIRSEVDDVIGLCSQSQGQFLTQKPIADTQSTQETQETQHKEDQGEEESQLIVESTPDTVIMTQNQSSQSQMLSQTDFQSSANTLTGKFYLDF